MACTPIEVLNVKIDDALKKKMVAFFSRILLDFEQSIPDCIKLLLICSIYLYNS